MSKQLKPNDRIIAVAQGNGEPVDCVEMKLRKVVEMIRGPAGTEVRLTVVPASSPGGSVRKIVTLIRDEIKIAEQYAKAKVIDHPDENGQVRRLGLITLPQFYDNCARDVEKLLVRLQKENVSGVILDLRRNGGGLLDEAIALTGLFIRKGPVVQVRDNRKPNQVFVDDDDKVAYDGPLVVLVGHLSASASEITAAALQDYGRALIVGDQSTHGKGTVQSVLSLDRFLASPSVPNPGNLKLTVSKFYRIAGGTTQKRGVAPDILLPSLYDYMEIGEDHLPNCLPADETTPLEYERLDRVRSFLSELQRRSLDRTKHSQDFAWLGEDIERLKKQREDKTVSLNEAQHLKEQGEEMMRTEGRQKLRAQRPPTGEKVFEVNLDIVDQNKPIVALSGVKQKESDRLAAVPDSDAPEDASEEDSVVRDFRLEETLSILNDYVALAVKDGAKLTSTTSLPPGK